MKHIRLGLAYAAALMGLAGCGEGAPDKEAAQPGASVTIELPEQPAVAADPAPNAAVEAAELNAVDVAETPPAVRPAVPSPKPVEKPAESLPEAEASEEAGAAAAAEKEGQSDRTAQSAPLPLPNAAIVRTLERIGFACGSIVSSSRLESASGSSDYRINCSSGASYRASNRTGRYRFSKAGGRD